MAHWFFQAFEEIQGLTDQADKLIGQKNLLIRKQETLIRKVSSLSGKMTFRQGSSKTYSPQSKETLGCLLAFVDVKNGVYVQMWGLITFSDAIELGSLRRQGEAMILCYEIMQFG